MFIASCSDIDSSPDCANDCGPWNQTAAVCCSCAVTLAAARHSGKHCSPPLRARPRHSKRQSFRHYETQKLARTYVLDIPAPRGQITDRNGAPLAQKGSSYNLAITYPTPLDFSDTQVLDFTHARISEAEKLLGHRLKISDELILRHYHNRGILPFEIAQNLSRTEYDEIRNQLPPALILRPFYIRIYPNGKIAGQIIGYSGKTGRNPDGVIDNHEVLWPETEGREGLEQTFNHMLTGQHGEYNHIRQGWTQNIGENRDAARAGSYGGHDPRSAFAGAGGESARGKGKARRDRRRRSEHGRCSRDGVLADLRSKRIHPDDFIREIQGTAGRSEHSTSAARISLILSAGFNLQGRGWNRRAGKRHGSPDDEFDCAPAIQIGNLSFTIGRRLAAVR